MEEYLISDDVSIIQRITELTITSGLRIESDITHERFSCGLLTAMLPPCAKQGLFNLSRTLGSLDMPLTFI